MNKPEENTTEALKKYLYNGANEKPQFIIFSPKITNRLTYTCRFVFNQWLLCNFNITSDESEFVNSQLNKINYSDSKIDDALTINPSGFLFETGVKEFVPVCKTDNNKVILFADETTEFGFDIFSAVFYLISRYEEWQKYVKDNHGRFEVRNSILYKLSILKLPVIDYWLKDFKKNLIAKFPRTNIKLRDYNYISTIDVDNVYAFKAKPLYRNIGGGIKDILGANFSMFVARIKTVLLGKKDPFDAYDEQMRLSRANKVPLIYFFLYRNGTNFDRTINPDHPLFIQLLNKLKINNTPYGLHPSYFTTDDNNLLVREKQLLEKNSGVPITISRQHYLRFNIKTTPKQLADAGIKFDFTMGFASAAGFRAGTGMPFYYYDFENERELPVMAVPFALMDGAYYIYDKISLQEVKDEITSIAHNLKQVNGLFITVFHDRSFSEELYPGWQQMYAELQETIGRP